MRRKIIVVASLVLGSLGLAAASFAHEGETHEPAPPVRAGDHAHKAPHGGMVNTAGSHHVEMVVLGDALEVYLLDGEEKTLPVDGRKASAVLQSAKKGKQSVAFEVRGDRFRATPDLAGVDGFIAVVTIEGGGETVTSRFRWDAKATGRGGDRGGAEGEGRDQHAH